ncbi:hypothetical protein SDC9_138137 [bioreactor metagenome]|uniref:Uncharacterized protein n=1 Tax=bioreactor metagenome TaxID=1076179 RepID=A0A645DRA9_9ZZZZ
MEENQAGRLRLERPQFPVPLFSGLVKEYSKILLDAAGNENVTVEEGSYLLPESGMTAEGRLYVFQPGQKELEQMILKLADACEKEDGLKQLIRSAGGAYGQWLYSQNSLGRPGESYEAFLDRTLSEMAARMREQAGEISAGLAEAEFRWLLGISGSRVQLQRLEWKTGAVGYESFGDETAERQDIVYSLQEEYPGMLSLTRSRKADAYSGRLDAVLGNPGEEFSVLFENVTPAKRSALGASYGTYELLYDQYLSDAGIDRFVLEIKAGETGGSDHVVRFTEGYSGSAFELKLHSSDERAAVVGPDGAPVSISAGELEKLVSDLQTHLQYAVMGALF